MLCELLLGNTIRNSWALRKQQFCAVTSRINCRKAKWLWVALSIYPSYGLQVCGHMKETPVRKNDIRNHCWHFAQQKPFQQSFISVFNWSCYILRQVITVASRHCFIAVFVCNVWSGKKLAREESKHSLKKRQRYIIKNYNLLLWFRLVWRVNP